MRAVSEGERRVDCSHSAMCQGLQQNSTPRMLGDATGSQTWSLKKFRSDF